MRASLVVIVFVFAGCASSIERFEGELGDCTGSDPSCTEDLSGGPAALIVDRSEDPVVIFFVFGSNKSSDGDFVRRPASVQESGGTLTASGERQTNVDAGGDPYDLQLTLEGDSFTGTFVDGLPPCSCQVALERVR